MGMVMAADLSRRLGLLSAEQAARVRDILENDFSMPVIPRANQCRRLSEADVFR